MGQAARVFTPATLAQEWGCSERHVRNLVAAGQLRAFRLGSKLLRIPAEAVEEFACQHTASGTSEGSSPSSSGESESGTVTALEPLTRARLNALRRRSSQS
jgi:excisionase family DNA binding protein